MVRNVYIIFQPTPAPYRDSTNRYMGAENNLPKEGDKGIGTQLARAAGMPGQAHCINPL